MLTQWQGLSEEEKAPYVAEALADKARFAEKVRQQKELSTGEGGSEEASSSGVVCEEEAVVSEGAVAGVEL